ncbi:MAG: POTRA domain-containing protein, partial [Rhodospirillales bacterium]
MTVEGLARSAAALRKSILLVMDTLVAAVDGVLRSANATSPGGRFALGLLLLTLSAIPTLAQEGAVVREIVVEGTQRVEPSTVRSYLLIQTGDRYEPGRVDRSLKSLYATGLFADV